MIEQKEEKSTAILLSHFLTITEIVYFQYFKPIGVHYRF